MSLGNRGSCTRACPKGKPNLASLSGSTWRSLSSVAARTASSRMRARRGGWLKSGPRGDWGFWELWPTGGVSLTRRHSATAFLCRPARTTAARRLKPKTASMLLHSSCSSVPAGTRRHTAGSLSADHVAVTLIADHVAVTAGLVHKRGLVGTSATWSGLNDRHGVCVMAAAAGEGPCCGAVPGDVRPQGGLGVGQGVRLGAAAAMSLTWHHTGATDTADHAGCELCQDLLMLCKPGSL